MLKKILKIFSIAVFTLFVGVAVLVVSMMKSKPMGETGNRADELAESMRSSLNYEGYRKLKTIAWTFRNGNKYVWNKKERTVLAEFQGAIVNLNFKDKNHEILRENELNGQELIDAAIAHFYNDSFWVVAPFKVFDKDVERQYVETKDGPGLLVTYTSGGITPGDSYLWVLDDNFRPKYWRIWTSNVPIKGMKFEWTDWEQHKGVWFALSHKAQFPVNVSIKDIKID